jgi:hypothetical protein
MRILKILPVLILLLFVTSLNAEAQCKAFAKKECLPLLAPFTHDGNYHAAVLVEGEEAELYKTFYSDMEYRLAIIGEGKLPTVEFTLLDENRNVVFSSKENKNAKTFDFKLESSKQLKLVVKVPQFNKAGDIPASGCVAIMFGFKVKK